jgi:hypothetical protein
MKVKSTHTFQTDVSVKDFLIELRNEYIKICIPTHRYDYVNLDSKGYFVGYEDHSYRNTFIAEKIRMAEPKELTALKGIDTLLDIVDQGIIPNNL